MMRRRGLCTALLAGALSCLAACSHSDAPAAAPQVPADAGNLVPAFGGVKCIATAGGGSVRLCWAPANDDRDAPGQIRYRVYASTVRGGQDFGAPLLETAPGTTCVTIAATPGTRSFYVVRAVDTENAEEDNRIELSVTPLGAANVRYVDAGNPSEGSGTLNDPYRSIQDGVEAAEGLPGGGIVLVAMGHYREQVRATADGTAPLQIFGGFPSWALLGPAPTPEQILASFDATANPTTIDGTDIQSYTTSGEALVQIENDGRPTCLGGLRIENAQEVAIGGVVVDLEVSCCRVRDPQAGEIDNITQAAVRFVNPLAAIPSYATVVGSDLREFQRAGVEASGFTALFQVSGNFIGQEQANSDSTTGIGMASSTLSVVAGEVAAQETLIVPTEWTTIVRMENNEIFRTNDGGIDLDFEPEQEGAPGTTDILIRGNDVSFIGDGEGVLIDDLLYFGDGGSASATIDRNRFVSISAATVSIDCVSSQSIPDGTAVDGPVTITVTDNWMSLADDGVGSFNDLIPPPGGTCSLTYDNNQGVNIESTGLDVSSYSPEGPGPIDGVLEFIMTNNRLAEANDYAPELYFPNPPGTNGLASVRIEGNLQTNPDSGSSAYVMELDAFMGSNPEGTAYNQHVEVCDNVVLGTSSADFHVQLDCFTVNGTTEAHVMDNFITGGGGIQIFHDNPGLSEGPPDTATFRVVHNFLFIPDGVGLDLRAEVTGLTVIDVLHNYFNAREDPIWVSVNFSNSGQPNGRAHTTVFNNRVDSSDDLQFVYHDNTSPANGEAAYLFCANNNLTHGADEDSGAEVALEDAGMALFANNFVGFGEVDSETGLQLLSKGANPGLMRVLNNLFGSIPGNAVDFFTTNTQFINNTVAYNGMGGETGYYGIVKDRDGVPFIQNSIVYRNGEGDLQPSGGLLTSYSLIGDRDPAVGFGDVVGDPIFNGTPDLFNFNANYMLRLGSPAIDAGHPDPQFNDPDGTRNDLGAFGGPGAGWVGSFLPIDPEDEGAESTPAVPLRVIGVGRPFGSGATIAPMVDMHAAAPLGQVGPEDPILIVFTLPVEGASLSGIGITADGVPVAGNFVLRNGGRVAEFVPAAPVPAGDVVKVNVGSAVVAADTGAPLAVAFASAFGTLPEATPEAEDAAGPDSNGSTGTAEAIAGTPSTLNVTGTLFDSSDSDFYSFTGFAGERLQATVVTARLATPNVSAMTLTLYDTDGTTVLTTNPGNAGLIDGNLTDPFVDMVIPAAGTYYLEVSGGSGSYGLHWFIR